MQYELRNDVTRSIREFYVKRIEVPLVVALDQIAKIVSIANLPPLRGAPPSCHIDNNNWVH